MESKIQFSVIMPTYNNSCFIRRAILSLQKQTYTAWELIVIDDGSTDYTYETIKDLIAQEDIKYIKNETNKGLGAALNTGIEAATHDYIAYLPADDIYYADHLEKINIRFEKDENIFLVVSGMDHQYKGFSAGKDKKESTLSCRENYPLQLVQTAHKKTTEKWLERKEWITKDLYLMYWNKLLTKGLFALSGHITCSWTLHANQRQHMIHNLNIYRSYYNVKEPLKVRLSRYQFIDEEKTFAPCKITSIKNPKPLKILLIGELGYNQERILAFEELGHELYGVWIKKPVLPFANIGPLPFGNITDIPNDQFLKENIQKLNPDVIYALGNWDSIELAHDVIEFKLGIPFVWHFKESPLAAIEGGTWYMLQKIYANADGRIFINELTQEWFEQFIPTDRKSYILDLDIPKKECFSNQFTPKLSSEDNEIHTVVVGRMLGLRENDVYELAQHNIHVHTYAEKLTGNKESKYAPYFKKAPGHFHIHTYVGKEEWTKEFSKYDAGWLHVYDSRNENDLLKLDWDDLNIPARIFTLMSAGIPSIQKDNTGHRVAVQEYTQKLDIGIHFRSIADLVQKLQDKKRMEELTRNCHQLREQFTFDYQVHGLIDFFKTIIKEKNR